MNHETELKVQAWLDGELPAREAEDVQHLAAADAEAGGLLTELRQTREALAAGEVERPVPASREFYWSQIERAIRADEARPARATGPAWQHWLRWLIPVGAVAGLALFFSLPRPGADLGAAEIENHLDDLGSFMFRSDAEGVTVIWIASN